MNFLYTLLFSLLLTIVCLGQQSPAIATSIELYLADGTPHPHYDAIMADFLVNIAHHKTGAFINAGDELVFSNGKKFVFQKFLGAGTQSIVIEVDSFQALRMPMRQHPVTLFFMQSFADGMKTLGNRGHSLPHFFWHESHIPEYILAENLIIEHTLNDLLAPGKLPLSALERERRLDKLADWAFDFGDYAKLGDFREDQLGWNKDHWVLLDIDTKSVVAQKNTAYQTHPLGLLKSFHKNFPVELQIKIDQAVARKRKTLKFFNPCAQELKQSILKKI